jgi:hypothetical protein
MNWIARLMTLALALPLAACGEHDHHDDHDHDHEHEGVFTTVKLSLTPPGGAALTASFSDPDGVGGAEPTVAQPGALTLGTTYAVRLELLDESSSPAEDLTDEVSAEAEEHQVFFRGEAVGRELLVAYADKESDYTANATGDDLPVGLRATFTATAAGSGALRVSLAHLPPVNGAAVKVAGVSADAGDLDADVTFQVTVR